MQMASLRQLLLISSLVMACMLVGVLAVGTGLMARELDDQMRTQAENAAATLALLTRAQADDAARQQVLDAAFQQGRFTQLALKAPDGRMIFDARRRAGAGVDDAPAWFVAMADVAPHEALREVAGAGQLRLVLDAGPARQALWTHVVQWIWLALGIAAFWALFVASLKARLRKVLGDPDASSGASIHARPQDAAPSDDAVELLVDTGERVAPSVQEQHAHIEQLRIELNRDPETGLANRGFFLNTLKRLLRDDARLGTVSGFVLLARARDMAHLQNQVERAELADWLHLVGRRLGDLLEEFPDAQGLAARLNGSDIAVLFPVGGGPDVMRLVQRVQETLESLRIRLDGHQLSRWAFALTDYTGRCAIQDVLQRLDQALMRAESAGRTQIEFLSRADQENGIVYMGEAAWRALICQALDHDRLSLRAQSVEYEGDDLPARHEAALSLQEDEPRQPAMPGELFMPAAVRLGLSAACDVRAVCLALGWLGEHAHAMLVIRVSAASLLDPRFQDEVCQVCERADPLLMARLVIELDAFALSRHPDAFRGFAQAVAQHGLRIGLRGLDQQPDALRQLHEVDFAYVKLGGGFVRDLRTSPGGVQMLVAITETAIGMGVRVYADDAEDDATRRLVLEYGALPRVRAAQQVPA